MTEVRKTGRDHRGVDYYALENNFVRMTIVNLGCRIQSLETQDRQGHWDDIVLGYQDVNDCHHEGSMMGALVGRVANRIGKGRFVLGDKTYQLETNCGPHHIHGGRTGFDQKLFETEITENGLDMHYHSPDMEEGYPGNMDVTVRYRLRGRVFFMEIEAVSDQDTLVNLTNHTYFNLSGQNPLASLDGQDPFREKIYAHELRIAADRIACVDNTGLPGGDYLDVRGTAFDFLTFHPIGQRINEDHIQLRNAGGYDHPYLLTEEEKWPGDSDWGRIAAQLYAPVSGRRVSFVTDCPTIQLYTANFLAGGCPGKHGRPYENRDGAALECQYLSNSIQIEKNSPMILKAGERRSFRTSWIFDLVS